MEKTPPHRGMEEKRFWAIIEASRTPKPIDLESHCAALKQQLDALSREDLIAFAGTYALVHEKLNDFHLWAVATILGDGCTDDGFEYFKDWIITQGNAAYEAATQNPDSLADLLLPAYVDCNAEIFSYVAGDIYEERYDDAIDAELSFYSIPFKNRQLSRKDAEEKFPKLAALAKT